MELFAHPFSSYCWKVLIALYENDLPFTFRMIGPDHPENGAGLARLWPVGKFPLLVSKRPDLTAPSSRSGRRIGIERLMKSPILNEES